MLLEPFIAPLHEGTDGRRRSVEDTDLVFVDDAPEAVVFRPVWSAFIHEAGRAEGERAIDDVAVAGDPADVGRAPVNVVVAKVEDVFASHVGVQKIAAGGVQDAFRFAGRSAGVEDEQR